ncbi:MAG TPA: SDR family oxidoreductase [Nitrospinaceae bacterium]|jgi:NAD(P)-dependent dehydrogenase (short-subunit alcohol dehydrogenase family)|nr:SDR family oxidoreductase [Nitrospinaceae bacterium]HIK57849.1 SDR family oxidoreductase [Nitrospinaceae bacterium]
MTAYVVVTGAGSGIGRCIAQALAEQDFSLFLLGRNLESLETTKKLLKNSDQHQCQTCDIRKPDEIRQALKNVSSLYGLIANAGIGGENQYGEQDRWKEIMDTNLTGTYQTIQECLPFLKKNSAPFKKIIIISSILARLGVPGYSGYCASKAGLLGLTRSLAAELSNERILVNALCPGWVNTDMAQEGLQGFADALNVSKEEAYTEAMKPVPLGKMSKPEEIAQFVAYLISPEQTSITGQTLDINNGALMP